MNSQNSNATTGNYSDKTASYYAGMPFGLLLVKTMERAQMANVQGNHVLEFTLLRDYYSYSSSFMSQDEQKEIKRLLGNCNKTLSSQSMSLPSHNNALKINVSLVLSKQLFELKEKLFAYTSDLLNKASSDEEVDIDKEFEDV